MNFGPRKIVISIAAIPAIRIWPRSIADEATSLASSGERRAHCSAVPRRPISSSVEQLEADRARALDQQRVARLEHRLGERHGRLGIGSPGVGRIVAGELANPDDRPDAELSAWDAGLSVIVARRSGPAPPSRRAPRRDGQGPRARPGDRALRASRSDWRCSSRSRRRFRRPARPARRAGAKRLSPAPAAPSHPVAPRAPRRSRSPPGRWRGCAPRRTETRSAARRPGCRSWPGSSARRRSTPRRTRRPPGRR